MKKQVISLFLAFGISLVAGAQPQEKRRAITLEEAITIARVQSVDAAVALNELKTAYWEYRTFRADLLPEMNFEATIPSYNKKYNSYQHPEAADVLFPALQRVQRTVGGHDIVGIQKIQRSRCAVHRQRVLFQEGGKPLDVVAVLVGDKDACAIADGKPQRFECCRGGAHPLAHINDKVLCAAAHHAAVAGGAGIQ